MNLSDEQRKLYKHKNFIFWVGIIKSLIHPVRPSDLVLDYGCGYGLFLQLLYEQQPFLEGIGIDRDNYAINEAKTRFQQRNVDWPLRYLRRGEFQWEDFRNKFDLIFCQEVFWMNEKLSHVAQELYTLLKPSGHCYCTTGNHPQNPLWEYRRQLLADQGIESWNYTIDDVARIFAEVGFNVGIRRLPIEEFIMYHPVQTSNNARSLSELVQTTYECKMLFYFGKGSKVEYSSHLQG